jgi:hypothetical protein
MIILEVEHKQQQHNKACKNQVDTFYNLQMILCVQGCARYARTE